MRILVLSDSCHSGTVTRAGPPPPATAHQRPKLMPPAVAMRTYREHQAFYDKLQRDVAKAAGKAAVDPDTALAKVAASGRLTAIVKKFKPAVVLISGCQDNQTSMDGDHNGAFTEQLLKVWSQGTFQGNYGGFHARIKAALPPSQSPNLFTLGVGGNVPGAETVHRLTAQAATGGDGALRSGEHAGKRKRVVDGEAYRLRRRGTGAARRSHGVARGGGAGASSADASSARTAEAVRSFRRAAGARRPKCGVAAEPGKDIVVLRISGGPALYLRPESAADLIRAQVEAARQAMRRRKAPEILRRRAAGPGAAPVARAREGCDGAQRRCQGGLGDVLLDGIDVTHRRAQPT